LLGEGVGWKIGEINEEFHPYRSDVFTDQYKKENPREPASTVNAHIRKDGHMSIHPREARSFTVREAARLQSFKDTYKFPVSRSEAFEQVGNAVPPLVAEALGAAIMERVLRCTDQNQGSEETVSPEPGET
jgi:DNA (cytosine-5)-methyltransferase 1